MNKKVIADTDKELSISTRKEAESDNSDKYLTELKELPPEMEVDMKNVQKEEIKTKIHLPVPQSVQASEKTSEKFGGEKGEIIENKASLEVETEEFQQAEKHKLPFTSKDIILAVINLATIIFLVIILSRFSQSASELKDLRNQSLVEGPTVNLQTSEIESSKDKAKSLENLFLEESGVVDFVNEVEKVRAKGRSIVKVTFASNKAIKDRTENFGVPIIIEMKGSWQSIGLDLEDIEKIPFLFRSAMIESRLGEDDPSVVHFKYGLFLYVNEKLGQTR